MNGLSALGLTFFAVKGLGRVTAAATLPGLTLSFAVARIKR